MASLVFVSFVISLYKKSLKSFFTTLWSYTSLILTDYYTKGLNTSIGRLLSGIWLMACTVLLAAFSGILRDQQMKPQPVFWIDSIEDLWQWKDLKFQTNLATDFAQKMINADPSNEKDSRMAYEMLGRMDLTTLDNTTRNKESYVKVFDAKGVLEGKVAIVYSYYYLHVLKNILFDETIEEDIDFHLSRKGDYEPLFTLINRANCNKTIAKLWNFA